MNSSSPDAVSTDLVRQRWVSRQLGLRLSHLGVLLFVTLLVSSGVYLARGAGAARTCTDFDNVTICADNVVDLAPLLVESVFRYDGNVTIARKGQAPLLKVVANPLGSHILHVVDGNLDAPTVRFPLSIFGALQFINEPNGQPLISTIKTDFPNCGGQFGTIEGKFKINTVEATIVLPTTDEIVSEGDLDQCPGVQSLTNAFRLDYLDRNGITQLFEANETSSVNLTGGIYKWDLTARKFNSQFNFNVKLNESAENPNLQLTLQTTIDELGKVTGAISAFKVKIAGLLMAASGVTLQPGVNAAPATFKAATVKVLKVDNPNQPSFDPIDTTLIFEFTNLKYSQGKWEIDGAEVGIPDLAFGTAFALRSNRLGILNETANGQTVQSIQIKSTMRFGVEGDGLPIVLRVGRTQDGSGQFKPVYQAGLQDSNIKLGVMTFKLKNVTFVGNEAENFWGLKANSAELQWPANMGGQTAAGVTNFKLGVNKDQKLQFALGNGTIGLPAFENQVFRGTLQATIGVVAETMTITGTGSFTLKLAGNNNSAGIGVTAILRHNRQSSTSTQVLRASEIAAQAQASGGNAVNRICFGPGGVRVTCPNDPPPTTPPGPKPFELRLAGFNFKLGGFGLSAVNPRGTDDGGFAVDSAGFTLPLGLNTNGNASGLQVQGLVVKGNGDVSLSGGGFELPTLKIGDFQILKLIGNFKKEANGNYAFTGGAKFPLPGIEPGGGSPGIGIEVTIRVQAAGGFGGAGVKVDITLPPGAGIPIGNSGLLLTNMNGLFDLNNGTVTFGVGVGVSTAFQIPLGPLGSLPLAKINGNVAVQVNPFLFTANAELSVLIFQMANAAIKFGDGQGFDNRSGLNVTVNVVRPIMSGNFRLRYGKGTATDPNKRRFAAAADWTLGVKKGQYGFGLPPFDLVGLNVALHGGIFNDTNNNPSTETIGVRGNACILNGNVCTGLFINLREDVLSSKFLDFTNIDKYALIPAAAIRAAAARGEQGFASRLLSVQEANELGLVLAAGQQAGIDGITQEVVDIPITQTTTLLAGIDYFNGTPLVRLQLPDNTILSEGTVNGATQVVLKETAAITKSIYFVINGTTPGTYKLLIDNIADYQKVSYTLNNPPKLTLGNVTCSPSRPPTPVSTICLNNVAEVNASAESEINASSATINWTGSDLDSPNATVDVGYIKDAGDPNTVDFTGINIVAEGLPLAAGSHAIDFLERGEGKYRFVVIANDGVNGAVFLASSMVVSVTDNLPPAVPTGLTTVSQAGELLVKWTQNTEADLAGYDLGFGLVNDPAQFIYTRTMGSKVVLTGTNNIVDAKIWGLDDNVTIFYGLRAYDSSGNYSDWTPLQSATPWALAPNAWSPIPNGFGEQTTVEVAFAVPMNFDSLQDKLVVKDSNGTPLAGTTYYLTDLSGNAIGIGIDLTTPYNGAASAVLKGGDAGVRAADNRAMNGDFTWSFTINAVPVANGRSSYLPIIMR